MPVSNQSLNLSQTDLFRANLRKSHPGLLKAISENLPRITSGLLITPLFRYHETRSQQPVRLAPNQLHQFLHHRAVNTCSTNPASPSSRLQSMSNNYTRTIICTPRSYRHTSPVNKGLNKTEHRSSSLCNICVHLFDPLHIPDHAAIPITCIKHQDHPDLLDLLSPRTYRQLSLRLSSAPTFNTAETTQTLYSSGDLHPRKPFVRDSLIKGLAF